MVEHSTLLTWMVFIPLLGMAVVLCLPGKAHNAIRWTATAFSAPGVLLSAVLLRDFQPDGGFQFIHRAAWIPSYHIEYFVGVDGVSLTMVLLTALLSFLCMIASFGIEKAVKGYFALFLLLETGMIGTFVALDFFLFYVFWEVMLLPMYFLIGIWGGPRKEYAAIKFFLYTLLGSVLMLVALLYLYFTPDPHSFDMTRLGALVAGKIPLGVQVALWMALFIGFAIKIPAFPFHTWLPDAHVEAPTAISVILAGVLLKMGTYGILRINYGILPAATLAPASELFSWMGSHSIAFWVLAALGTLNIVYGALCAMAQQDLKKLVAYSSISHMGYVMLGMAAFTDAGINGAVLQMFNHGTITAMLFLLVGVIYDRAHHRDINGFGGLASLMPRYTFVTGFAFFAAMGIPGLSAFISEVLVLIGAWGSTAYPGEIMRGFTVIAASAVVLTAGYMLWALQRMYLGAPNPKYADKGWEISGRELFTLVPLAVIVLVLGVYPKAVLRLQDPALRALNDRVVKAAATTPPSTDFAAVAP
jgi:NADH-quinone oxidoreductase subunit M